MSPVAYITIGFKGKKNNEPYVRNHKVNIDLAGTEIDEIELNKQILYWIELHMEYLIDNRIVVNIRIKQMTHLGFWTFDHWGRSNSYEILASSGIVQGVDNV